MKKIFLKCALAHGIPVCKYKQNNGICYMAEQEFGLFTIPFIGMKGMDRPRDSPDL